MNKNLNVKNNPFADKTKIWSAWGGKNLYQLSNNHFKDKHMNKTDSKKHQTLASLITNEAQESMVQAKTD